MSAKTIRMVALCLATTAQACQNDASSSTMLDGERITAAGLSMVVPRDAKTSGFDPATIQEDYPCYSVIGEGYSFVIDFTEQPLEQSERGRIEVSGRIAIERIEARGVGEQGSLGFPTPTTGENFSPVMIWKCSSAAACRTVKSIMSSVNIDWPRLDTIALPPEATPGKSPYPEMPPPPPVRR